MEIKGKKYDYIIEPFYGKVLAEIYKIVVIDEKEMHIHIDSKEFGSFFKSINKKDYENAKEWAESQIKSIYFANN